MQADKENGYNVETTLQVLLEMCPWLKSHIRPEKITQVKFHNVSRDLLVQNVKVIPIHFPDPESGRLDKSIFFFTEEGKFMGQAGFRLATYTSRRWIFCGKKITRQVPSEFPETILDAIKRVQHETTDRVYFIISLLPGENRKLTHLAFTAPRKGQTLKQAFDIDLANAKRMAQAKLAPYFQNQRPASPAGAKD